MKLIIDIDDKIYEFIKNLNYVILARGNGKTISMHIMRAIKQGLPYKERPQGEWKYVQYDANPNIGNWHCSECRHIVSGKYNQKPDYNFCPRCGVKMGDEKK